MSAIPQSRSDFDRLISGYGLISADRLIGGPLLYWFLIRGPVLLCCLGRWTLDVVVCCAMGNMHWTWDCCCCCYCGASTIHCTKAVVRCTYGMDFFFQVPLLFSCFTYNHIICCRLPLQAIVACWLKPPACCCCIVCDGRALCQSSGLSRQAPL